MRKAFTLIELVVALAILAIMMMFASTIFRYSINAQRMAVANSEIMQKLRVITEQLDADFRGMMPQYGGGIRDQNDTSVSPPQCLDSIAFFTNGDFQSTYLNKTVVGNVAAVLYGTFDQKKLSSVLKPQERMLLRNQTILTEDSNLASAAKWGEESYCTSLEQCRLTRPYGSLDQWLQWTHGLERAGTFDSNDLHMYLAKGVDGFKIWYLEAGVEPKSSARIPWSRPVGHTLDFTDPNGPPRAVKFEFTLYDSRGIIKNGRTFSHIVMLGG
jgi:prepilin-type N-terminal cleavage/methylation domain-containing protein